MWSLCVSPDQLVTDFCCVALEASLQADLTCLSELSELTDDERFRQSIAEVIYSLNELSDTLNLQRRYLKSRFDAE